MKDLEDILEEIVLNYDHKDCDYLACSQSLMYKSAHQQLLSKEDIRKAVGNPEYPKLCPCAHDHRNQLRSEILKELGL